MNEIVERVARAICCIGEPKWDTWPVMEESQRDLWRSRARAAIEALREPTEAMLERGRELLVDGERVWRAMIAAELTEKEG